MIKVRIQLGNGNEVVVKSDEQVNIIVETEDVTFTIPISTKKKSAQEPKPQTTVTFDLKPEKEEVSEQEQATAGAPEQAREEEKRVVVEENAGVVESSEVFGEDYSIFNELMNEERLKETIEEATAIANKRVGEFKKSAKEGDEESEEGDILEKIFGY